MTTTATVRDPVQWIGLGCMRLSTEPARDEAAAVAVLHAAFDAGVDFLDTADAYCRDATDVGHNERLIARALSRPGAVTARGSRSRRRAGSPAPRAAGFRMGGPAT